MTKARDLGDFISDGTIAETVTADGLNLGDNEKIQLGASQDLQIFHDGSHSIVKDSGTGNLKLLAENFSVQDPNQTEQMILATPNGSVNLYYDAVKKFETTATGATVTGTIAVSGDFNATSGTFTVQSNGTDILNVTSTLMSPQTDGAISIGSASNAFNDLHLDGSAYVGGNVGIGTSSVNGALHVQANPTAEFSLWGGGGSYGRSKFNIQSVDDGTSVGKFQITTESTVPSSPELMTITNAGNVGIGTSSPSAPLTVAANSGGNNLFLTGRSADGFAFVQYKNNADNVTNAEIGVSDAKNMQFYTNGSERLRLDSAGNLGLGRSDPADGKFGDGSSAFVTSGNGTAVGSTHFATNSDDSSFIGMWSGHSGAEPAIAVKNTKALTFGNWSNLNGAGGFTERMRIDSSGDVDIVNELKAGSYNETYAALSGTSPAVNCETGNVFALSTSGNTTFTFTNPPASGTAYGFTLKVTAGGTHTLTWPSSVDWAGGTAPDAPASGETNVLVFITYDGGTTWYGFQAGAALA